MFFFRLLSQLMLFSCESDKLKRTDQTSQQSAASVIGRRLTDVSTPRLLDTLSPYPSLSSGFHQRLVAADPKKTPSFSCKPRAGHPSFILESRKFPNPPQSSPREAPAPKAPAFRCSFAQAPLPPTETRAAARNTWPPTNKAASFET
jgi:hypothetical protein